MTSSALVVTSLPGVPDFTAAQGDAVALLGPPGSGKTRALLEIAGRTRTAASVLLDGAPVDGRDVGLLRQDLALLPSLTAAENLCLPLLTRRLPPDRGRIERLLSTLRLPAASWYNLAEQLSGGQQQRVGLARALIAGPKLLCLDEPFTELDAATAEAAWAAIRSARAAGAVVVVATSDPDLAARCDLRLSLSATG